MIDNVFLAKLLLSFLVGGAYIAFSVYISERLGSRIGGVVTGLPSTSIISLLFIGWTQTTLAAVQAIPIMPLVNALDVIYVFIFIKLVRLGNVKAIILSLTIWFAITIPFVMAGHQNLFLFTLVFFVVLGGFTYLTGEIKHRKVDLSGSRKKQFLYRSVFSGLVIATAVFLGKVFGPVWGGAFACFPAAFTCSFFFITRSHGPEFAESVAKNMPLGSTGITLFCLAAYFLFGMIGLLPGAVVSYLVALAFAVAYIRLFRS